MIHKSSILITGAGGEVVQLIDHFAHQDNINIVTLICTQ